MDALKLQATRARYFVTDLGVKRLLGKGIDARNTYGETAPHVAASSGQTHRVKVLLAKGANIHAPSSEGSWTALHLAARGGHIDVVKLRLDRGTSIDDMAGNRCTALACAAHEGHIRNKRSPGSTANGRRYATNPNRQHGGKSNSHQPQPRRGTKITNRTRHQGSPRLKAALRRRAALSRALDTGISWVRAHVHIGIVW